MKTENLDDFETASKRYFDLICLLADLSPDSFEDGIKTNVIAAHKKYSDLVKNGHLGLSDYRYSESYYKETMYGDARYIEFDNTYVRIIFIRNFLNDFACKCSHRLNDEYYNTLCKHLVAAIDHICRDGLDWPVISRNIEMCKKNLVELQESNIERISNTIYDVIEPESKHLIKKYLQRYVDAD